MRENEKYICGIDYAFQRIGGKYKGRILWGLHWNKVVRYGQFRKKMVDISTKMLTQTLRELEEDGLICRTVYREIPPRVEYSITEDGKAFIPFIEQMLHWGRKKLDENYTPQEVVFKAEDFVL